jgi:hypothetical protein
LPYTIFAMYFLVIACWAKQAFDEVFGSRVNVRNTCTIWMSHVAHTTCFFPYLMTL